MQESRKTEIREIREEDHPALIALWCRVFEDPEALCAAFLRLLPELGSGVAAFVDGTLAGCAYIVTGLTVGERRAGYLYAVAVHPEFRGAGLGGALSQAAAALGRARGADFICTLPASAGLYAWYEALIGVRCALRRRKEDFPARPGGQVTELDAAAYNARRERLLADQPHLSLSPAAAEFEAFNCRLFGGGFFSVGDAIAAVCCEDGRALVRELLCPEASQRRVYAAAIAAALGCSRVILFSPGGPDDEAYLAAEPGAIPGDCVWDLAFD